MTADVDPAVFSANGGKSRKTNGISDFTKGD
jgi:hypothetical protein